MDTLENVGIIDPKSGELVSFEREGACGDGNQDFMRYYRLSDTKYFLYKIEMRPCMGGAWKTVLELRN